MVFLVQKIRRKFYDSSTIVILADRDELNTQISDTFENCSMLGKVKASQFIASSGDDLTNKLKGNPNFIFTLIQKFNKTDKDIILSGRSVDYSRHHRRHLLHRQGHEFGRVSRLPCR